MNVDPSHSRSGHARDVWHVDSAGVIRWMTTRELDDAFRAGTVHGQTRVLPPDSFDWTTFAIARAEVVGEDTYTRARRLSSIAPVTTDATTGAEEAFDETIPAMARVDFSFGAAPRQDPGERRARRIAFAAVLIALVGSFALGTVGARGSSDALGQRHDTPLAHATPPAPPPRPAEPPVALPPPPATGLPAADPPLVARARELPDGDRAKKRPRRRPGRVSAPSPR